MGCCIKKLLALFVLSGVGFAVFIGYLNKAKEPLNYPSNGYWGPQKLASGAAFPKDDEKIYKFSVDYDAKMVAELREELSRTKWFEPLEDSAYHYGVNLKTFRDVIEYWRTKFDFTKAQNQINAFPNYKTEIEGLKIHFLRSSPKVSANVKVLPLLMIHGWPGSFVEFLKVAAMLNKPVDGVAFDIIVPSIPGYGFSDPSRKQGMDVLVTARIFNKLMKRLGYSKYYIQGGDWGSAVTTAMAGLYPEDVRGIHTNMLFLDTNNFLLTLKQTLFTFFPGYFGDGESPKCLPIPFKDFFKDILRETGYMHLQSTKPDTVGFGLLNTPAGLAAYIMEKFSTWTQSDFRFLDDGGLGKKFSIDDVLSNVMVYFASGSIISSQRYYREFFSTNGYIDINRLPVNVPVGYAIFPNELSCSPRFLVSGVFKNLTTLTYQKDGGHFAAFEQPELLEKDVRLFVNKVEELYPEKVVIPKDFVAV